MNVNFETVDVFTDTRFAGNQLAVLPDARGLSARQMQAIAAEFGYAETSFVLPPDDPANTARVRIFTPAHEMPFAGHPNVGTAFVLARLGSLFGRPLGEVLRFEEIAGLVEVRIDRDGGAVAGARVRAPLPLSIGPRVGAEVAAALAGLHPADILLDIHAPCFASVGAIFLVAEVTADALDRAGADLAAFDRHRSLAADGFIGLQLHAGSGQAREVRMFAPTAGVVEDAATGSAAGALGALLHHLDPNLASLTIRQGRHIGRPSRIEVRMAGAETWIGGPCVPVMAGQLHA